LFQVSRFGGIQDLLGQFGVEPFCLYNQQYSCSPFCFHFTAGINFSVICLKKH